MDILTARLLANELYTSSTERLREFAEMPDVFLSLSTLISIQRSADKIGAEELLLLNGVAASFASSPQRYAAGSIITTEEHVADTLADMMAKYAFLYPDYTSPCNAEQAFNLGGDATSYGKAKSFSIGEHSIFSSSSDNISILNATLSGYDAKNVQNGICIASDRYCQKHKNLNPRKRYSVSFVYLKDGIHFESLLNFAKEISENKNVIFALAEKENRLFFNICKFSQKLSIFPDRIPEAPSERDDIVLTEKEKKFYAISNFFFNKEPDKCAIAIVSKLKSSSTRQLNHLAEKHGVEIYHPIEINNFPRFVVSSAGKNLTSLPSKIFRAVMRTEALNVKIPVQVSSIAELPDVNKIEFEETKEAVYTINIPLTDTSLSFLNAVNAIIRPFMSAAYDGKNTQNSDFSISVNAKLSMSDEAVGGSYAALLGIYRAITETGIITEGSYLTVTDAEPSLAVALKVTSFKERAKINTALSQQEFLKLLYNDGKMPDFSALRAFINGQNI